MDGTSRTLHEKFLAYLWVTITPLTLMIGYALKALPAPEVIPIPKSAVAPPHPRYPTGPPVSLPPAQGVASRGPIYNAPAAIRRRARSWIWKRLEVPNWRLLMTDHFAIRGEVPVATLRVAGIRLEEVLLELQELLGGDIEDIRFSARVFRSYEQLRVYASVLGASGADSFYDPRTCEMVVHHDPSRPPDTFIAALRHEAAHLYLHRVFGITDPPWINEGLAEYLEHFSSNPAGLSGGGTPKELTNRLRGSIFDNLWIHPETLTSMIRIDFTGPHQPQAYDQSWLMVHRLLKGAPPGAANPLRQWLNRADGARDPPSVPTEIELRGYLINIE